MRSSWSVVGSIDSFTVEGNLAIRYKDGPDERSLQLTTYDYSPLGVKRQMSLTGPADNIPIVGEVEYAGSTVFRSDVITTNLESQLFVTEMVLHHGKVRGDFINLVAGEDALYLEFFVSILLHLSTLTRL